MNLRDLRYLVAVADHRHFGRAAEACFVSQPTLSTQLKKLETELGAELIERSSRHVLLTDAGEQVVARARLILDEADSIRDIAKRAQDPESGSVRMGIFPTLAPYLLPHVVPVLHKRFPNLELLLVEEKTEVVLQRLASGALDCGILALPLADESLHVEPLFTEPFVLATPVDHPLASSSSPVDVSVLAGEHVLLLEEGHCLREQALSVCRLAGAEERGGFRATSLETLRQMVAAGVGVTLLPSFAVQPPVPPNPDVALVPFREAPTRELAMCWRRTSVYRDVLPAIADVIRDAAPSTDPPTPRPQRARRRRSAPSTRPQAPGTSGTGERSS
ncbi:MAG TPA: LysR substrate-binding domain-containing protein [Acidimicrobiales bacterium]|nr:LysR substrate-binding domain-containing protein [Acidimicrobiales bacterium]